MTPAFDPTEYVAPLAITMVYMAIYYGFQIHILVVKNRLSREYKARGEKFDRYFGQDRELLAADRYQLNTLEHMSPFLWLMWLSALFVGPGQAAAAGGVYVVARALYPLMMGKRLGRGVRWKILFSTFTGYGVLVYFCGRLIWALLGG